MPLRLHVAGGRWIGEMAEEAVRARAEQAEDVEFTFNGITLLVTATDTRESICLRYDQLFLLRSMPVAKGVM